MAKRIVANMVLIGFFDKQIEEGKLAPMMILFVDSIDSDRRSVELPPNPDFTAS